MNPWARLRADERGNIFVIVIASITVILFLAVLVVDVGHWFTERRDLQNRADAGALAAGGAYGALLATCSYDAGDPVPADNDTIVQVARGYAGEAFNLDPRNPARDLVYQVNTTAYGQADQDDGGPCLNRYDAGGKLLPYYTDVRAYENDPGGFFAGLMNVFVARIAARARVQIEQAEIFKSGYPFGVPDVNPKLAKAILVNECTGATIAEATLTKDPVPPAPGLVAWGTTTPVQPAGTVPEPSGTCESVDYDATTGGPSTDNGGSLGVRILLAGGSNTVCGQSLVECYDAESANGLWHVRTWEDGPTPGAWTSGNPGTSFLPVLRAVTLTPGGCVPAAQFSSAGAACTFGVSADIDFGDQADADSLPLTASGVDVVVEANGQPLTAPGAGSTIWTGTVDAAADGPTPVTITWDWERRQTGVTWRGLTCTGGGSTPCKASGTYGVAARAFVASFDRSGPIKAMDVRDATTLVPIESLRAGDPWPQINIGIAIEAQDTLGVATQVTDPPIYFRAFKENRNAASQSQSLNCDPTKTWVQEITSGCTGEYKINDGMDVNWNPCPDPTVMNMPYPWQCVDTETGQKMNQFGQGMQARLENFSSCVNVNHWSDFPNFDPADPRIINLFVVPYGTFATPGQEPVPITLYGTFYVTGWDVRGNSNPNHCDPDNGGTDDPADPGQLVGHFINYTILDARSNGKSCDPTSLIPCVPVLVR